jgi:peptidoglycan/xylan/chitin deacetylase (PgdA/CDA1 family)
MNLVSFSIKTKGPRNFARRLWTVFARFGFSEGRTRRALQTVLEVLRPYQGAPTFFIPATVLRRHGALIAATASAGAEIGAHGYVHNDYRSLSAQAQHEQTKRAIAEFDQRRIPCYGFRNPYLGWTDDAVRAFARLGLAYDSNEAVWHDVVDVSRFPPDLAASYQKSRALFQALGCDIYPLRPHCEGQLVRLPTSIPDDEMLFDRLHITDPREVGRIWCRVLDQVYALGGIYILNLHPERAVLCRQALEMLLARARDQALPVWLTTLHDAAQWWQERRQYRLTMTAHGAGRWRVEADSSPRATVLVRYAEVEGAEVTRWTGSIARLHTSSCLVRADGCPCIALSPQTPEEVAEFLREQGYPALRSSAEDADHYALYVDLPRGLGTTRTEQLEQRSALVRQIEQSQAPLVYFGCWPDGCRAALAITGDIDSVTVQDFFLRVLEVSRYG